jgi:Zn-finger nucleic acid-binding protein
MNRRAVETRLPCPVCLGVTMTKARMTGRGSELTLDACPRCGGIWFELGEVQQLRAHPPAALWKLVQQRHEPHRGPCHNCQAIIDRNADKCEACGEKNRIECPSCQREMDVQTLEGLRLDTCRHCRGVWFDHVELEAVWKLALTSARKGRSGSGEDVVYGAHAAGMAIQSGAQALTHAPEVAGAVVEGAGEVAAGAFEAIVAIISGIFE